MSTSTTTPTHPRTGAHFTDRDERLWQRHAEEPAARPLPVGAWLRTLRATLRTRRPSFRTTEGAA
ncbi:hypothetical protein [Streptomyces omiyaensis]|uniref:Uncharacterized protein n=1 Tax=Streptomyces omiyaensis TaxID=68247 RepID=A0ABW7C3I1_9ACTN|nr:hypothetical protein [Streptomyces omiyaensis]GGY83803.1 hypothetical protein GCM10010363_75340 [Streptomyces omiyaensis]